MRVEKFCVVK